MPEEKFALIIHDCILTVEVDVLLVKTLLQNRVRELYKDIILPKHNLEKLFKTELVSITDDRLAKNQRDVFLKQQYEDGTEKDFF